MFHSRITKAKAIDPTIGWSSRGYLPHFDGDETFQFITYRLADSLPRDRLDKLKNKLFRKQITEIEYHREIERYLDLGHGPTFLRDHAIAAIVEENLFRFDGEKYSLLHWVIMPKHVHLMIRQLKGVPLHRAMHSLKSFTANRANRTLGRTGNFWNIEYYDRYIRNAAHYTNAVNYIHANPVKANLCTKPGEWAFGCARHHE